MWLPLAGLFALSCATTTTPARPTAPKDAPVVAELRFVGNEKLSDDDLRSKILTSETSAFDFLPFVDAQRFDPIAWNADLRRIERYYQSRGFYGARVVGSEVVTGPEGDEVHLEIRLDEGGPTLISEVSVTGLDSLPEAHREEVLEDFPFKKGEVFRETEWEGIKERLRRRLHELGYAEGAVEGDVEVDVATRSAKVRLALDPGARYRFGSIFVAPVPRARVRREWIIQQAREAIREGDWYSESALAEAQNRVFAMGVFGAVRVNRSAPDRASGTVPVVIDVREAPFRTIRAGGGLGIDLLRYEGRVLTEYTNRNFFGGLRRLSLQSRVGYAYLPRGTPKTGPIAEISGEFEQPRFLRPTISARTSLELERGLEPAYDFYGGRLKTGVVWRPFPHLSVYPSYNYEHYRLTGEAALGGRSPQLTFGCSGSPCVLSLSYLEQVIEWDRRDQVLEPRSGHYLALAIQEGGGLLQGNFDYFRLLPEARYYTSFGDDQAVTLALRLRFGTLLPARSASGERRPSDSPIVARFFGGGANGMRGFSERRLSPMQALLRDEDPRNWYPDDGVAARIGQPRGTTVPIGGNGLVESSVEARLNVFGDLVLASFLDSGLVTPGSLMATDLDYFRHNLLHAVGMGIRYRTLVGPIRLDIAYRLPIGNPLSISPVRSSQPQVLIDPPGSCFGLFGKSSRTRAGFPEGPCTLHLSIGEAF